MGKNSGHRGLFKRGGVWWIRTDPISGKARTTECRDLTAAKAYRAQRELLAVDPTYRASETASLAEWAENLIVVKRTDKSPATLKIHAQKLGHFIRIWGPSFPLAQINPGVCDRYVVQRRTEGVTDHTIVKEFSSLAQLLKLAARAGCYNGQISLLRPTDVQARYEPRTRALSVDELVRLMRECRPKVREFVELTASLGLRLSEALKVEPEDIDRGRWTVKVRGTKTKSAKREIPVLAPFRLLIDDALPLLPLKSIGNLLRALTSACKRAGIDRCTPNDLRRSHATLLIECGVDRDVVRRLLGHTTSTMVERVYGKPRPEALAALAQKQVSRLALTEGDAPLTDAEKADVQRIIDEEMAAEAAAAAVPRAPVRRVEYPRQGPQTVYSRATLALAQAYADLMSARKVA